MSRYKIETELVHFNTPAHGAADPHKASAPPLYLTATFKQPSASEAGLYDYTRSGNPTRTQLETHMAKLFGARRVFAVSCGMSALDVIVRLLKPGDEVVTGADLYGGTNRLMDVLKSQVGITVQLADSTDLEAVRGKLTPKTRFLLLESPTNPLLQVADLRALSAAAKSISKDCLVIVDNTVMSPLNQRPLTLGADVHYESGTKYINGHHDVMSGFIAVDDPELERQFAFTINATGSALAPFDSWLVMRGVKTMALRLARQSATAAKIADWLVDRGYEVNYPGLASHKGHEVHSKQAKGAGAVLSFRSGSEAASERIVNGVKLWGISVSFGACDSLITMLRMSHAAIPRDVRRERGMPEDLIRLCVGIEDADDLIQDLQQAIDLAEDKHEHMRNAD